MHCGLCRLDVQLAAAGCGGERAAGKQAGDWEHSSDVLSVKFSGASFWLRSNITSQILINSVDHASRCRKFESICLYHINEHIVHILHIRIHQSYVHSMVHYRTCSFSNEQPLVPGRMRSSFCLRCNQQKLTDNCHKNLSDIFKLIVSQRHVKESSESSEASYAPVTGARYFPSSGRGGI